MNPGIIPGVLLVASGFAALFLGINQMLAAEKAKSRSPFTEKMLRPAGESLRLRVDEIRDDLLDKCLILAGIILFPGLSLLLVDSNSVIPLACWAVFVVIAFFVGLRHWKKVCDLRDSLRNHRLGFEGERYVASELNVLIAQGYHVFHDLVVDWRPGGEATNFNIDHIAVGPEGVFAVETKTRRKPNLDQNGESHKVIFNGRALTFPGDIPRSCAIDQAKKNAKVLAAFLSRSDPGSVEVRPLVVIPGWCVKADDWMRSGVQPATGLAKRLPALGRGPKLSPLKIKHYCDLLELKCRNVEG